jgi:predicted amidohydrolase YtcJ
MQIDDQERRKKHIEVILKAVADRFKSLGYAVIMQPRVICGRNALSLIVGDTCDEAAHLHAAESTGAQAAEGEIGSNVPRQFAQHLFISTVLLSDTNIPDDSLIQ